jgi:hypothetical protein
MSKLPRFSFQIGLMLVFVMASLIGLAAKADPGHEPQPAVTDFDKSLQAKNQGLSASSAYLDFHVFVHAYDHDDPAALLPLNLSLGRSTSVPFPAREPTNFAVSHLSPAQPPGAGAGTPLFDAG